MGSSQECYDLSLKNCLHNNNPQNNRRAVTFLPSDEPSTEDKQDTTGEVRTNSEAKFSFGLLYMDTPVLAFGQYLHTDTGVSLEYKPGAMEDRD